MDVLKRIALLGVSVFALAAAIAAPASAGTADLTVDSESCPVSFYNSGAPPNTPITITYMVGSCIVEGGGTLTVSGWGSTFNGWLIVDGIAGNCGYSGTLTGNTAATELSGNMGRTSGFLCPNPVQVSFQNITY